MQALHERVKPILFINKVDRLIKEIRLTPEEIQKQFAKILVDFNDLVQKHAPEEHKRDWQVRVEDDRVAFGSAIDNWGLNLSQMKTKGITFKEIIETYAKDAHARALNKRAPVHEPVLDMFIMHLPSPREAQPYRQSQIWKGKTTTPAGQAMAETNAQGPLLMCITAMDEDPGMGITAIGRVFSGTACRGKTVHLVNARQKATIQQAYLVMLDKKVPLDNVPAGNIAAVSGLPHAQIGETISEEGVDTQPFEQLTYVSDPVFTVAIKPRDPKDLPNFEKTMRTLTRQDPNLHFTANKESGECLLSGMGELHLEIAVEMMRRRGVEVTISEPTVIYRETISRGYEGPAIMGKSQNKHNKIWITIEKLPERVIEALKSGKVAETQQPEERQKTLKLLGWSAEDARNTAAIEESNVLVNRIKGRQYPKEVLDHVKTGFREAMTSSALTGEPAYGLKINLEDIAIHEDPRHRGPRQISQMTQRPIWCAFLLSEPKLLEPLLQLECKIPNEYTGNVTALVQKRRGRVSDMENDDRTNIKAEIPVSESFGIAEDLRSSTQGRAFWATQFSRWAPVPDSMQTETIQRIRERKGLNRNPPEAEEYYEQA
jgi:elongation factor 2